MKIISHFFTNMLKERIKNKISMLSDNLIDTIINSINNDNQLDNNYLNIISSISDEANSLVKSIIVETFKELDDNYRNSYERKAKYNINKSNVSRTIVTLIGEITITRTYYESKNDGHKYFYLDDVIGLDKYDHYDPIVKAVAINTAFETNFSKAGKLTGERLMPIKSYFDDTNKQYTIPRQSICNWIKEWEAPIITFQQCNRDVKTLFIMGDEKYIGCQDLDNDIMSKAFVVFEGVEKISKGRRKLINKTSYTTYSAKPWEELIDILNQKYDLEKIENIYILSDGARWLKKGTEEMKVTNNVMVKFLLCEFHFKQSINRITSDADLRNKLLTSFNNDKKKTFINNVEEIIKVNPDREENIRKNLNYIINNYNNIKDMINFEIGSSMESHISHNVASLFSSRPKGYASTNINKYFRINDYKNNNFNISKIYIQSYKNTSVVNINEKQINAFFPQFKDTYSIHELQYNKKDYQTYKLKALTIV